jgi:putative ABC transport system permease protein
MYIFQNALKNVARNKGRNILLAAIIFAIIITSVVALMINNTANAVINDYKDRFGAEIIITPNMDKLKAEQGGGGKIDRPQIDPNNLIAFGESEYIQSAEYAAQARVNCEQLNAIDAHLGGGANDSGNIFYHKLSNIYGEFTAGLRILTEGSRMPVDGSECIISQVLLENSGLSIGDTILLTSILEDEHSEDEDSRFTEIYWEMTIVGTFDDYMDEYPPFGNKNAYSNNRNAIMSNIATIGSKMIPGRNGIMIDAKYYLKDPSMLDAFAEELYAKGLPETMDVTIDESSYNTVVSPVEGLKGISITFVIVVLIFGGIIIALLSSIAIRERKYEIGVLRAMGMKKGKVALGLWSETLIITVICLVIGLGAGFIVAQPIANVIIQQQVEAAEQSSTGQMQSAFERISGGNGAEPLDNINVTLQWFTLLEIIGIALLITSVAGFISTRKITKYEPIKILMERN